MLCAVRWYFDQKLEKRIVKLLKKLADEQINAYMVRTGQRPHLTVGQFETADPQFVEKAVQAFAQTAIAFPVGFYSVGAFHTQERTIFLSPVPSETLIEMHGRFHSIAQHNGLDSEQMYQPGHWVPHCTVAHEVDEDKHLDAFVNCYNEEFPFVGNVTEIALVQLDPIREMVNSKLG